MSSVDPGHEEETINRLPIPLLIFIIGIAGCSSTKAYIDCDRDIDPSAYATFA